MDLEQDYQRWLDNQISLLGSGRFEELDMERLIEEMEEMGVSYRRALTSHLIILIAHLLKWKYQPGHRCNSWLWSIVEQRVQIEDIVETAPSLKQLIPELSERAYPKALKIATRETGMAWSEFPEALPFSLDQMLDDNYLP